MIRGLNLKVKDSKGNPMKEGDIVKWPDEKEIGVIKYEAPSCQFRIQFDPALNIPSCNIGQNVGKKGKAFVIGSIYDKDTPPEVDWAKESVSEKEELKRYEPLVRRLKAHNIVPIFGVGEFPVGVYSSHLVTPELIKEISVLKRNIYHKIVDLLPNTD